MPCGRSVSYDYQLSVPAVFVQVDRLLAIVVGDENWLSRISAKHQVEWCVSCAGMWSQIVGVDHLVYMLSPPSLLLR